MAWPRARLTTRWGTAVVDRFRQRRHPRHPDERQVLPEGAARHRRRPFRLHERCLGTSRTRAPSSIDGGLCFGDIDGDGDLDIAGYANLDEPYQIKLYRNDNPAQNWLSVRPIGSPGNRGATGAKIRLYAVGNAATDRLRIHRDLLLSGRGELLRRRRSRSAISGSVREQCRRRSRVQPFGDASCGIPRPTRIASSKRTKMGTRFSRTVSTSARRPGTPGHRKPSGPIPPTEAVIPSRSDEQPPGRIGSSCFRRDNDRRSGGSG